MSTSSAEPGTWRSVQAVIIRCDGDQHTSGLPRWSGNTIPADHPVFWEPIPPLASCLNIPIAIHRQGTKSTNHADLDNQTVTYLNIELESGFAPIPWQSGIGSVIIARKDRKPFLPQHLEGLFEYASRILDRFGDGDGPPMRLYNWQAFEGWWKNYAAARRESQSKLGQVRNLDDDWTAVKSPYEV